MHPGVGLEVPEPQQYSPTSLLSTGPMEGPCRSDEWVAVIHPEHIRCAGVDQQLQSTSGPLCLIVETPKAPCGSR